MIKTTLRSSACVFAIAAAGIGSALAADAYTPQAARGYKDGPAYGPATSWTGFYIGINGGYGWSAGKGEAKANAFDDDTLINPTPFSIIRAAAGPNQFSNSSQAGFDRNGGFAGGQIGYNWQQGHLVFGLEADLQGSGIAGKARTSVEADPSEAPDVVTSVNAHSSLDWFGTVRGRLGYAFDQTLLYATGGFAFGGVKDRLTSFTDFNNGLNNNPPAASASSDGIRTGYVLGGGLEYALTPAWSLKGEYQYINLGSSSLSTAPAENQDLSGGSDSGSGSLKVDHTYHTVRISLNYHVLPAYEPMK
jgi:outer membrane immunogenic protein